MILVQFGLFEETLEGFKQKTFLILHILFYVCLCIKQQLYCCGTILV